MPKKEDSKSGGYDDVIKCETNEGAETLLKFSRTTDDAYVTAQFSGLETKEDVRVKEFHYHRSCYRDLSRVVTRQKSLNEIETSQQEADEQKSRDQETRDECFQHVIEFLKDHVVKNGQVVRLNQLASLHSEMLVERGIRDQVSTNASSRTKSKLQDYFRSEVDFFQKKSGLPMFVYCNKEPV